MKKIIIFTLTLITLVLFIGFNSEASNKGELRNILDLSNLKMDHRTGMYNTKEPIMVEKDMAYTFVIDKHFLGTLEVYEIVIENDSGRQDLPLNDQGPIYMATFIALGTEIHIIEFSFSAIDNANMMLYKGVEDDFDTGFIPYNPLNNYTKGHLIVDCDKKITKNTINAYISAEHPIIEQLQLDVVVIRNSYEHKIGTYEAVYHTTINNLVNTLELTIDVVDLTPPVVQTTNLEYDLIAKPVIDDVIKDISIYDNVDTLTYKDIAIISNTYEDAMQVGEYTIDILVSDKSGNMTEEKIFVNLKDTGKPEIIGPNALFTYTTKAPLSEQDIIDAMIYKDDVDTPEQLVVSIINNEYNETNVAGKYTVTIQVKDSNNNVETKDVVIHVIANEQGVFLINEKITTSTTELLSEEQIIDFFLEKATLSGINVNTAEVNKDVYDLNYNKEGTYKAYVEYNTNDEVKYAEITIEVVDNTFNSNLLLLTIPAITLVSLLVVIIKRKNR